MVHLDGFGSSLLSDNVMSLRKFQLLLHGFLLVIKSYIRKQNACMDTESESKVALSVAKCIATARKRCLH